MMNNFDAAGQDAKNALSLLELLADPVAAQKRIAEFSSREIVAKEAEAAAEKKILELGDLQARADKLASAEADLNQREAALAENIKKIEKKRDAIAQIGEWADREHKALLADDRLEKLAARLAQTTIRKTVTLPSV